MSRAMSTVGDSRAWMKWAVGAALALLAVLAVPPRAEPTRPKCDPPVGYQAASISGHAVRGVAFEARFGGRFALRLVPNDYGWIIHVRQDDRTENLARLTPPWHFTPNPRYVEGWHFRDATNTAANDGSVNAPQEVREFFFSPEVGRSLEYQGGDTPSEVVEAVRSFGVGRLTITDYALTPYEEGGRAAFLEMDFDACLIFAEQVP